MRVETYEVEFTCSKCGRSFLDKVRKEVIESEIPRTCFTCMSPMIQGEAKLVGFVDTEVEKSDEVKMRSKAKQYEVWLPLKQIRILEPEEVKIAEAVFGPNMVVACEVVPVDPSQVKALGKGKELQAANMKDQDRVVLVPKEEDPFANKQKEGELDTQILERYAEEVKQHVAKSRV